ncbi:MAG: hypothetical protein QM570_19070 [Planctomycetota bacterium]|nr:hypothetical protein [Planctomycetota bacterium]
MRRLSLWIVAAVLLVGGAVQAQMFDITNPGDPLVGVPDDGNWPAGEEPPNAIDDDVAVKYLCFETSFVDIDGNVDTANGGAGFRVTPSGPKVVVKALNFATANDGAERDPVAFRLSGSDESIDGPYTLIAEGTIDEFDQATAYARLTWLTTPVAINNRKAYTHYELLFTDIRDRSPANSMQIGEVELLSDGSLAGGAGVPVPKDEAIDVARDVVLSWMPGEMAATHDVYFGTVFEDVNAASRTNPMGVLVSQDQTALTYDPAGLLEFGQTYYWRVDEVNSAPDFTIFKGDVWTFTAEPFAYPIANVAATTNAISDEAAGIENTVNGSGLNDADEHSTVSGDMWLARPGDEPIQIEYEFDRVYKLHEMLVWNYNVEFEIILGFGLKDVTVEYSADGVEWTVLGDVEFAKAAAKSTYVANTAVGFDGVAAKYVRLTVNSAWGTMGQYGLSEVRFLYIPAQAREPQPADEATAVAVDSSLTWRAGREAVSHEVYFGTDPEALDIVATTAVASQTPGALDLATTYYWRVDEVNDADAIPMWEGGVWSFTTQEYIVVEDFESYTDDIEAGEAIFDTWLDGWVNNTGSTVGHLNSPFAEQTIVKSGKQSMPLSYENTSGSIAEAEYTLQADWAANGVKSLSLAFYGDPANTGQLYIKINNTKIVYDGDADDIKKPVWQAWNIDLSAVGNVNDVTKLTIGIEGAGAKGVVYVDDIRLYPNAPEYITPVQPDSAALVAHYALDGNANDSSGRGNNGTVNGIAAWVTGKINQALQFDGGSTYVDCGSGASLNLTDAVTITAWVKLDVVGGDRKIAGNQDGTTGGYKFGVYTNDRIEFEIRTSANASTLNRDASGGTPLQQGVWYHVAGVYSREGAYIRTYVYGGLDRETEATAVLGSSTGTFKLGRDPFSEDYYWLGAMDDVRVYNQALSQEEILGIMGQTAPMAKPF